MNRTDYLVIAGVVGVLAVAGIDILDLYGVNVNVDLVAHAAGGVAVGAFALVALRRWTGWRRLSAEAVAALAVIAASLAVEVAELFLPHAGLLKLGIQDTQGDILAVWIGGFVAIHVAAHIRGRRRSDGPPRHS